MQRRLTTDKIVLSVFRPAQPLVPVLDSAARSPTH